jgi:hypothetical protein
MSSAASTAADTEARVDSMLTTTPLRRPDEGATPTPMISKTPFSLYSPTTARVLAVPMSRPTIRFSVRLSLLRAVHHRARAEIDLLYGGGDAFRPEDVEDE